MPKKSFIYAQLISEAKKLKQSARIIIKPKLTETKLMPVRIKINETSAI